MSKNKIESKLADLLKKQKDARRVKAWKKANPTRWQRITQRANAKWRADHPEKAAAANKAVVERYQRVNADRDPYQGKPKACPRCGKEKPRTVDNWARDARRKDGLNVHCKLCRSEMHQERKEHGKT